MAPGSASALKPAMDLATPKMRPRILTCWAERSGRWRWYSSGLRKLPGIAPLQHHIQSNQFGLLKKLSEEKKLPCETVKLFDWGLVIGLRKKNMQY